MIISGGAAIIVSRLCDAFLGRGDELHIVDDLSM
jgi:hypothetical protein